MNRFAFAGETKIDAKRERIPYAERHLSSGSDNACYVPPQAFRCQTLTDTGFPCAVSAGGSILNADEREAVRQTALAQQQALKIVAQWAGQP